MHIKSKKEQLIMTFALPKKYDTVITTINYNTVPLFWAKETNLMIFMQPPLQPPLWKWPLSECYVQMVSFFPVYERSNFFPPTFFVIFLSLPPTTFLSLFIGFLFLSFRLPLSWHSTTCLYSLSSSVSSGDWESWWKGGSEMRISFSSGTGGCGDEVVAAWKQELLRTHKSLRLFFPLFLRPSTVKCM